MELLQWVKRSIWDYRDIMHIRGLVVSYDYFIGMDIAEFPPLEPEEI